MCSQLTQSEAEAKLAEILRPINAGVERRTVRDQAFGRFVENVFLPVSRRKWKRSTAMSCEQQIASHLTPTLASFSMRQISREELQELLDSKAAELSKSVLTHLRFHLRAIFGMALSEGVVDRNPARVLHTPRICKPGRQRAELSPADVHLVLSVLDRREQLIARLAIYEGMRPGEILGLQVGDFEGHSLLVRRRIYKGDIDAPKNGRQREIGLSPDSGRMLGQWIDTLPCRSPEAWVFPSENPETPITRDNVWRRNMVPRLATVGCAWATFQVMRRTHGSQSKKGGIDPKVAADQRGHGLGVAMEVYTQSDLDQKREAARRLQEILDASAEERSGTEALMQ